MCGRYTLTVDAETLSAQLELEDVPDLSPRYNLSPTQEAPVVRLDMDREARVAAMMRWGLVPFWADDVKIGNRMINARSETVASKPAFRAAFKSRRCLVPADGFYEWRKMPDGKQPYRIVVDDGAPFAMAGLWESWGEGDDRLLSFTILTTEPNELVAKVHDRMPVVLQADEHDAWLDPSHHDREALQGLLDAFPAERMRAYPVSREVNSPANDRPGVIESIGDDLGY